MRALSDWRLGAGVALGLAAALAFRAVDGPTRPRPADDALVRHGPVLSDCDGALRALVVQYVPEAAAIVDTAYRQFLGELPGDVVVYCVVPDSRAFDGLRARVGPTACRLVAVPTGHAMTCWSRDRWLAFAPAGAGEPGVLLCPREEAGAAIWPQREGDGRIAADLAAALAGQVAWRRSRLAFDGGDFVADAHTAFVTPAVLRRNLGGAAASAADLRRRLSHVLQRKVVLLPDAPEHHAGMFMMLVGDRTAAVGDPALGRQALASAACPLAEPDFSERTQRRFDAVAASCAAAGYRVVRVPVVPGRDGRTYFTYLNVILDQRDGARTVYMPVYRGAEALNRAAAKVWEGLGFEVRSVDCTETYVHFGSLRCLVSVLRRT